MSSSRVVAGFLGGVLVTSALATWATPEPSRYRGYETFAQALAIAERHYAAPVTQDRLLQGAIAGMAQALDARSAYLRPQRYQRVQEDYEGEVSDLGIALAREGEDAEGALGKLPGLLIAEVSVASPAELAGLVAGDRVLVIDGARVDEAREPPLSVSAWQARLRGAAGSRVALRVQQRGARRPREVTLVRARRRVTSVRHRVERDVGVLAIDRFLESTATETREALAELERAGARALVLDLRANPGGVVEQALAIADELLDRGVLVTLVERERTEARVAHRGADRRPLVVLIDGGTASAAELLAAALADNERATLVGERTYGKGTVQTFFPLLDGGGLRLTTGWYLTPRGNLLESNGIQPHVKVRRDFWDRNVPRTSSSQTPSAGIPNGATIAPGFDDDPQLVAAVALARSSL